MHRFLLTIVVVALVVSACSGAADDPSGHDTPERAVVEWFGAIDTGDAVAASNSVNDDSLALILAIENDLDTSTTASYLEEGIPLGVERSYWESFADGFSAFAARPISTLTVGDSVPIDAEGHEYAAVAISGGAGAESIVFTRERTDGRWEVDVVATLADGFASLLADLYDELDSSEPSSTIRTAYAEVVLPAMWAAVADGTYGDDFNRVALTLIDAIGA